MFDFENLDVYQKAKAFCKEVLRFLKTHKTIEPYLKDQLRRAVISVVINIAEGSGKFSHADKRNFYTIARGSVYESVSLFEIIKEEGYIDDKEHLAYYQQLGIISKMLLGLINSQRQ